MADEKTPVLSIPVQIDADMEKMKVISAFFDKFIEANKQMPGPLQVPTAPPSSPHAPNSPNKKSPSPKDTDFLNKLSSVAKDADKSFKSVNKTLRETKNVLNTVFTDSLRWAVRFGVLAGGGMFGFDVFARHVSQTAMMSSGLNMPTGEYRAANNVYGTVFGNMGQSLNGMMQAGGNPSAPQYQAMLALGMHPGGDPGKSLPDLIQKVYDRFKNMPKELRLAAAESMGVTSLMPAEQFNRVMKAGDDGKLDRYKTEYVRQAKEQQPASGVEDKYQQFGMRISGNTGAIETAFKNKLAELTGPLGDLSDSVTKSVNAFLYGGNFDYLVKKASEGIKFFSDWISSPAFQSDLKEFGEDVKTISLAIADAMKWLHLIPPKLNNEPTTPKNTPNGGVIPKEGVQTSTNVAAASFGLKYWKYMPIIGKEVPLLGGKMPGIFSAASLIMDKGYPISEGGSKSVKGTAEYEDIAIQRAVKKFMTPPTNSFNGVMTPQQQASMDVMHNSQYSVMNEPAQHAQAARRHVQSLSGLLSDNERRQSLPPGLLAAVAKTESNFDPYAVSKKGAVGVLQMMPETGKGFGLSRNDLFDPAKEIPAGAVMLHRLMNKYGGNLDMALAAYNWGSGNLARYGMGRAPGETRRYIQKVKANLGIDSESIPAPPSSDGQSASVMTGTGAGRHVIQLEVKNTPGSDHLAVLMAQISGIPH